jgi:yeast amino acid transporter
MDASNLRARHSSSSPNDDKAGGYGYDYGYEQTGQIRGIETDPQTSLHRGLKARHISMIAIGGAIGTGCMNLPPVSFLCFGAFEPPRC